MTNKCCTPLLIFCHTAVSSKALRSKSIQLEKGRGCNATRTRTKRHESTGSKSSSQTHRPQISAVTVDDNDSKLPGKTHTPSSARTEAAREFAKLGNEIRSKLGKDAGANIGSHMAGKYCRQYFGNTFQLFSLFSFNHSLIS